jgi:hypothetical protein
MSLLFASVIYWFLLSDISISLSNYELSNAILFYCSSIISFYFVRSESFFNLSISVRYNAFYF